MKKALGVLLVGCLIAVAPVAALSYAHRAWDPETLFSADQATRKASLEATLEARAELVEAAKEVVADVGANVKAREDAIMLLGELRAPEAVDVLVSNLTLKTRHVIGEALHAVDYYVAASALAKIGKPAVAAALEAIKTSQDRRQRHVCALLIERIEGWKLARIVVQDALDEERDPSARANLQEALEAI